VNKTDLLIFLERLQKRPNKGLSQNFLIDSNIAAKIVKTADIQLEDLVLEIGSGPGILTKHLLDTGAHVFAIEKDASFAKELFRFQTKDQKLTVFHADCLEFDFSKLPSSMKVVSNLPYHITTPIFELLFSRKKQFSALTLMIQKEVAERLLAKPGTKEFSSLTLFTGYHAKITKTFPVSASCFYPQPKVASQVVHLELLPPRDIESETLFPLIRKAFQHRRKMLRGSLKEFYSPQIIEKALEKIHLPVDARPEALSLEKWIDFFSILRNA